MPLPVDSPATVTTDARCRCHLRRQGRRWILRQARCDRLRISQDWTDLGQLVQDRSRVLPSRSVTAPLGRIPVTRPQPAIQCSPQSRLTGAFNVILPPVAHVKNLRGDQAEPPRRLLEDLWVGLHHSDVRRGDHTFEPKTSSGLKEGLPSRPGSRGVRNDDDGESRTIQGPYESLAS